MNPSLTHFDDLVLLIAIFLIGVSICRLILGSGGLLEKASLSFGLGAGIFSWTLFIISWAGVPLTRVSIVLSLVVLITLPWVFRRLRHKEEPAVGDRMTRAIRFTNKQDLLKIGLLLILIGLLGTSVLLSIGLSYHTWDAIALWSVKGYGIALEESVFAARTWGNIGLSYPLNLPLLIGSFKILSGDQLPGSKLIFPAFYFSMLLSIYWYFRKRGVSSLISVLGILLIGSTPIVFEHAYIGYANLPFSYYLLSGILFAGIGIVERHRGVSTVGGLMLAFAIWTRSEGSVLWLASFALLFAVIVTKKRSWHWVHPVILPFIIVGVPWLVFHAIYGTGGRVANVAEEAIRQVLGGEIHWLAFYGIVRYLGGQLIKFNVWGILLPFTILAVLLAIIFRRIKTFDVGVLLPGLASIVMGGIVFFMYFLTSYSGDHYFWLSTGFNRTLLPAALLACVASILVLERFFNNYSQKLSADS